MHTLVGGAEVTGERRSTTGAARLKKAVTREGEADTPLPEAPTDFVPRQHFQAPLWCNDNQAFACDKIHPVRQMSLDFSSVGPAALLAAYLQPSVSLRASHTHVTTFTGPDGSVVVGEVPALRAVARTSTSAQVLLGATPAHASSVDQWLELLAHTRAHVQADVLARLEEILSTCTYVTGFDLTIADFAAYTLVRAGSSPAGPATSRWCSMMHELTASASLPAPAPAAPSTAASTPAPAPTQTDTKKAAKEGAPSEAADAGKTDSTSTAVAAAAAPNGDGKPAAREKGDKSKGADKDKAASEGAAAAASAGGKPAVLKGKPASKNVGGGGDSGSMPALIDAEMGKVVTRFPPEPSGYLHIGHAKALLLNDFYARTYGGRMLVRFDDTNPSKEKEEYEENILKDLQSLDVKFEQVTHTSDYFDLIIKYARQMISEGKAYMDDQDQETMRKQRETRENSKYRDVDAATNMARFDVMLKGGPEGEPWCLRAKIDMQSDNGTMRDPVIFRTNSTPHHHTGTRYKAYPTYDFACPIVDSLEGVTHALRSSEYHDRDFQYYWMLEAMGLRKVIIQDFSRLNFIYTLLSKRKLTKFVNEGVVDGWNDPRFPTVQGMLRRGLTVPALKEFIISQGASRRIVDMEWDMLWAANRKVIDPVAPRFTALIAENIVPFVLSNGPATPEYRSQPLHPKDPAIGVKAVLFTSTVLIEQPDAASFKENEEITLMKWGNAIVRRIHRDAAGVVTKLEGELHLEGDYKKTDKKVTWLPQSSETCGGVFSEFDYLIRVPKIEDEGDAAFQAAINPVTRLDTRLLCEPGLRLVNAGDIIQLERKCFARCDRPYMSEDRPAIFFTIPDGKVKGLYGLADRVKPAAATAAAAATL